MKIKYSYWQWLVIVMTGLWLTGCMQHSYQKDSYQKDGYQQEAGYQVDLRYRSEQAPSRIKVIVLHYTAETLPVSLALLRGDQVSAHYLIAAEPECDAKKGLPLVFNLVPDEQLAWHAGVSFWRGATRLNDTSLGIELVNSGPSLQQGERLWAPYPSRQMAALLPLLKQLITRYKIAPENIVAHSDIAPQRKQDPGPAFPWQWLAEQGVGVWPESQLVSKFLAGQAKEQPVDEKILLSLLGQYGYAVTPGMTAIEKRNLIAAFQMHFRPRDYRGIADAESIAIARALLVQQGSWQ